jgi:hypothetical protein
MRAGTLQFANPVADQQCRGNADRQMDVVFDAADLVEHGIGRLDDTVADVMIETVLQRAFDDTSVSPRMPGDVQVNLGVDIARHDG